MTKIDFQNSEKYFPRPKKIGKTNFGKVNRNSKIHILFFSGISDEPWDLDPHLVTCSERMFVYIDIWSALLPNRNIIEFSWIFLFFQNLKIKFLHDKIIFFGLDFFLVKIWSCRFQIWPLEHKTPKITGISWGNARK